MSAVNETPPGRQTVGTPTGRPRIFDAESFVFWVLVVVLAFGAIHTYNLLTDNGTLFTVNPSIAWLGLVLWSLYAIAFLAFVYYHQLFVRRSPWITLVAFAWGGLVATYFASEANNALDDLWTHWYSSDFTSNWGSAISAATNEETLKTLGLVVLVLLPLARVRSTLDGWFYGMMVGLGFQVVEDYLYTTQNAGDIGAALDYFWGRGLVGGLWSHAVFTGIVGGGIGFLVSRRDRSWPIRIGAAVGAFAIAWVIHFLFDASALNNWITDDFLATLVKGVPALVLLFILVHLARNQERRIWSAFVASNIDPTVVSEAEATALLDHKSRKQARKTVAHAKGHHAGRLQKHLQRAQLRYIQSVAEEGLDGQHAREDEADVNELRALIASA